MIYGESLFPIEPTNETKLELETIIKIGFVTYLLVRLTSYGVLHTLHFINSCDLL